MNRPDTFHLVAAALYLVPALIWFSMAFGHLAYLRNRRPGSPLFRLLPIATSVVGLYFLLDIIWALVPADLHRRPTAILALLDWLTDVALLASLALFRHFECFIPVREEPPSRAWLAANYGSAALVALLVALPRAVHAATAQQLDLEARVVFLLYVLALSILCAWQVWRTARGSGWGPGGVVEVRRPDVIIAACGPRAPCWSVHDSGPGVPAEVLPRLFDPFFSLKPQGTGLGLAIAKRTIEAHGGQIAATTSPPPGLTLRIDLPIASAE